MTAGVQGSDAPVTTWLAWIDAFTQGVESDPARLPALLDAVGAGRAVVLHRLAEAFAARADAWADTLRRRIADPSTGSPAALAAVLVQARRTLGPLTAIARSVAVPAEIREPMLELLDTLRTTAQRSLEDSVRAGRNQPALLAVVRDHSLLVDDRLIAPAPPPATAPPAGRRVIL